MTAKMKLLASALGGAWAIGLSLVTTGTAQLPPVPSTPPNPTSTPVRVQTSVPLADGPRIEFTNKRHLFGRVTAGEVIRHEFEFRNTGTRPIEIRSVNASCGCTTTGDWARTIPPGETGRIPIQMTTAGFSGALNKTVTIVSNALNEPTVILSLEGEAWVPVTLNPPYVYFTLVAGQSNIEPKTVRILSNLQEPFLLLGVETSSDILQTELRAVTPGREYELRVSIRGNLPTASHQEIIRIKTNASAAPSLEVKVYANVQNPVVATPTHLILPAGALPEPVKRYVTIRSNDNRPMTIQPPQVAGADNVAVVVSEPMPGRMFRIELEFPTGFSLEAGRNATLIVRTDQAAAPEFSIPIIQPMRAASVPVPRPVPATPLATTGPRPAPAVRPAPPQPAPIPLDPLAPAFPTPPSGSPLLPPAPVVPRNQP